MATVDTLVIPEGLDIYRVGKAYTVGEAAKLAGISAATVRRWLQSDNAPDHQKDPLFGTAKGNPEDGRALMVSFMELIELVVVARFRRGTPASRPVTLLRLRDARTYAQNAFGVPYPFASLKLKQIGGHVLHAYETSVASNSEHLALDFHGQWTLPTFVREEVEHNIDFLDQFARRWYPRGRDAHLVVDPRIAGGAITIEGRGVTIETLWQRWQVGDESIQSIAEDYELAPDVIEAALRR